MNTLLEFERDEIVRWIAQISDMIIRTEAEYTTSSLLQSDCSNYAL